MLFSSLTFLFGFLPLVLISYFLIKNRKYRNMILLIFSLIFYAWGEPIYLFLMLLIVLSVYIFGILLEKHKNLKTKKILLIASIIFVLLFLLFFKYGNFLINNINSLFNLNIANLKFALPIGISFFSFQAISYIIDLYRSEVKVQKNFFDLALYISLFPQLIAGPIVRYDTIEKELTDRNENINDIISGTKRFIIGLSKKVLIANQMAIIADVTVLNLNTGSVGVLATWLGAIAYTFQIYFDFSGYSDMAIGLGKIFGFHFFENFNYPYISKTITDFWRRWHISLSTWFRDYVYIPLGGNRVSKFRHIINILIVWMLTGFWHGASWNFIIWGLYYGILLIIEKFLLKKIQLKIPIFFSWLVTFVIVIIGWVIFRCDDISLLGTYLSIMFSFKNTNLLEILNSNSSYLYMCMYFIPAIIFSFPIKIKESKLWNYIENILLLGLFIGCIVYLTSSTYNPFIYFRF